MAAWRGFAGFSSQYSLGPFIPAALSNPVSTGPGHNAVINRYGYTSYFPFYLQDPHDNLISISTTRACVWSYTDCILLLGYAPLPDTVKQPPALVLPNIYCYLECGAARLSQISDMHSPISPHWSNCTPYCFPSWRKVYRFARNASTAFRRFS